MNYGHLIITELPNKWALVQRRGEGYVQLVDLQDNTVHAAKQADGVRYLPAAGTWLKEWEVKMVVRKVNQGHAQQELFMERAQA